MTPRFGIKHKKGTLREVHPSTNMRCQKQDCEGKVVWMITTAFGPNTVTRYYCQEHV